jgi:hypothetical protein
MSLDFNGTTSLVTVPAFTLGGQVTWFARMLPRTAGEGGAGVVIAQGPVATPRAMLYTWSFIPDAWAFQAGWSTTSPAWYPADVAAVPGPTPYGKWSSLAASYNHGATTNQPTLYSQGFSKGNLAVTNAAGTVRADNVAIYIGAASDGTLTFDGLIADVACWNRILTAQELALVHYRGPLAVPSGLQLYLPFPSSGASGTDYSGNGRNATLSNVTVGDDFPGVSYVITPAAGGKLVHPASRFEIKGTSYDPQLARYTLRFEEY